MLLKKFRNVRKGQIIIESEQKGRQEREIHAAEEAKKEDSI